MLFQVEVPVAQDQVAHQVAAAQQVGDAETHVHVRKGVDGVVIFRVLVPVEAQVPEVHAHVGKGPEGRELHGGVGQLAFLSLVQHGHQLIGDLLLVGVQHVADHTEQQGEGSRQDEQDVAKDAQGTLHGPATKIVPDPWPLRGWSREDHFHAFTINPVPVGCCMRTSAMFSTKAMG